MIPLATLPALNALLNGTSAVLLTTGPLLAAITLGFALRARFARHARLAH